jgi:molecular chaperone GrpE
MDSDEVESGQIVQTFQKGYKYKDRPLREAMVVVAN